MTKYLLTFHGAFDGMPEDQAVADEMMAAWGAWYGSIGEALVDPGAPVGGASSVGPGGSTGDALSDLTGYTVIDVADEAAAIKIAHACPVTGMGNSVQINTLINM